MPGWPSGTPPPNPWSRRLDRWERTPSSSQRGSAHPADGASPRSSRWHRPFGFADRGSRTRCAPGVVPARRTDEHRSRRPIAGHSRARPRRRYPRRRSGRAEEQRNWFADQIHAPHSSSLWRTVTLSATSLSSSFHPRHSVTLSTSPISSRSTSSLIFVSDLSSWERRTGGKCGR